METKTRPPIYAVYKRPILKQGTHIDKSEGLEKNIPCKRRPKKAGVTILISDKIDFQIKAVKRNKEGHYIMIKGSIEEEVITVINIYASNIRELHYEVNANKYERGN